MHVVKDGRVIEFFELIILRCSQEHLEFLVAFVGLKNKAYLGSEWLIHGALHIDVSNRERMQSTRQAQTESQEDKPSPISLHHPILRHVITPFYRSTERLRTRPSSSPGHVLRCLAHWRQSTDFQLLSPGVTHGVASLLEFR